MRQEFNPLTYGLKVFRGIYRILKTASRSYVHDRSFSPPEVVKFGLEIESCFVEMLPMSSRRVRARLVSYANRSTA